MSKLIFIFSAVFFISCINQLDVPIQNKKWRMVKQVVTTQDKKSTTTIEKVKAFSVVMDELYFDTDNTLAIVSYGLTKQYHYTVKDSILTMWPEEETQKANEYRITVSTRDSLVLNRTEIWGADAALKITATFHLVSLK